jgi:hypothetical protein
MPFSNSPERKLCAVRMFETMHGVDAYHTRCSSGLLAVGLQRACWWSIPRGLSRPEDKATGTGLPACDHNHEAFRCGGVLVSGRGVDLR